MAVFTEVSEPDVQSLLDRLKLGCLLKLDGILQGTENSNFFVECSHGSFVLTLFERQPREQIVFSLSLMRHLKSKGLPVPEPLPAADSGELMHTVQGRDASLVSRLPGSSVLEPTTQHCTLAGKALASLHLAGQDFARAKPNPHGLDWCKSALAQIESNLSDEQLHLMQKEILYQEDIAVGGEFRAVPSGPIHADLFRDNALFEHPQREPRLSGIFDFYFSGCNALLFDVAVCMSDWCLTEDGRSGCDEKAAAFLAGYQDLRKLNGSEKRLLNAMLRAAALRFWLSRAIDFHKPRKAKLLNVRGTEQFESLLRHRIARPFAV